MITKREIQNITVQPTSSSARNFKSKTFFIHFLLKIKINIHKKKFNVFKMKFLKLILAKGATIQEELFIFLLVIPLNVYY